MQTKNVDTLSGPMLNWAVAVAIGLIDADEAELPIVGTYLEDGLEFEREFNPVAVPEDALPLIDEHIDCLKKMHGEGPASWWAAAHNMQAQFGDKDVRFATGSTLFEAAMRAIVIAKLGNSITIFLGHDPAKIAA